MPREIASHTSDRWSPLLRQACHGALVGAILLLLGAQLLDRDRALFIGEHISFGEIGFAGYLVFFVGVQSAFSTGGRFGRFPVPYRRFSLYFGGFVFCTGLSWLVTTLFIDGELADLFAVPVRLAYYFTMALFVARWVRRFGPLLVVYSFCGGIFVMFVRNYYVTMLEMLTTVPDAIPVTNFSGVLLPVSALFFALLCAYRPSLVSMVLMLVLYFSTALIYSLAAYIFMVTALPAVLIIVKNYYYSGKINGISKVLFIVIAVSAGCYVVQDRITEIDLLTENVMHKLDNVSFTDKGAAHDQSMDYRYGQFQSSLMMTYQHPLFGVGKFNWENENEKNKNWVRAHHRNDNPHNALVQVLSMYGIPACVLFVAAILHVFRRLLAIRLMGGWTWVVFVLSTAATFIGSACVMDSFLVTYYFYFYAGVVLGIGSLVQQASRGLGRELAC